MKRREKAVSTNANTQVSKIKIATKGQKKAQARLNYRENKKEANNSCHFDKIMNFNVSQEFKKITDRSKGTLIPITKQFIKQ